MMNDLDRSLQYFYIYFSKQHLLISLVLKELYSVVVLCNGYVLSYNGSVVSVLSI